MQRSSNTKYIPTTTDTLKASCKQFEQEFVMCRQTLNPVSLSIKLKTREQIQSDPAMWHSHTENQSFSDGHTLASCALPAGQSSETAVSSAWAWGNSQFKETGYSSPGEGLCLPHSHSLRAARSAGWGSWRLSEQSCATTGTDEEVSQQELSQTWEQRTGQSGKGERPREKESITRTLSANHHVHPLFFCHDLLKLLSSTDYDLKIWLLFRHATTHGIASTLKNSKNN